MTDLRRYLAFAAMAQPLCRYSTMSESSSRYWWCYIRPRSQLMVCSSLKVLDASVKSSRRQGVSNRFTVLQHAARYWQCISSTCESASGVLHDCCDRFMIGGLFSWSDPGRGCFASAKPNAEATSWCLLFPSSTHYLDSILARNTSIATHLRRMQICHDRF